VGVKCCGGTVEGDGGTERLEAFEWDCDTLVGGRHCGYLLLYEVWRVEKHVEGASSEAWDFEVLL